MHYGCRYPGIMGACIVQCGSKILINFAWATKEKVNLARRDSQLEVRRAPRLLVCYCYDERRFQKKGDKPKLPFPMMMIDKLAEECSFKFDICKLVQIEIGILLDRKNFYKFQPLFNRLELSINVALGLQGAGFSPALVARYMSLHLLLHLSLNQLCLHFWTI